MAVRHLLLQSFCANEAIFQLMMLTYNLYLLFKMDFANGTEYRQQIKTFRLKYIFLAGKIILHVSTRCFDLYLLEKTISDAKICESGSLNLMQAGGNDVKLKPRLPISSPFEVKMLVELNRRGISNNIITCFNHPIHWGGYR